MEEEIEIWKDIKDFEGLYQVSTWGRVKSLNYKRSGKEGILRPIKHDTYGHVHVHLNKEGIVFTASIHRLVAVAFISNPENKPEVEHIDGNPMNNNVSNLRWCTHIENMNNSITIKRFYGTNKDKRIGYISSEKTREILSKMKKRPVVQIKDGQIIKIYDAVTDVEKDGFIYHCVSRCCHGKVKHHHGYQWMLLSEYEKMFGQLN